MKSITTREIADRVSGRLVGPGDIVVHSLEQLDQAGLDQLTYIGDANHVTQWLESEAPAALVTDHLNIEPGDGRAFIVVKNADLAMAELLTIFAPPTPLPPEGVHPTAMIGEDVVLGSQVRIGPYCVIGDGVHLGDHCVLQSSVTIMAHSEAGDGCIFWPGVVVRDRCRIGSRCIFHMNVNIGADGFGYRLDTSTGTPCLVKTPHIGIVTIGDDVEIGAGSCVDRGKFSATVIGNGSKIDNLVQIGHNCRIGRMVVIAGCSAIGGSVTIGDGARIAGMVAIKDHIRIGDRANLGGGAQVMNHVPPGETWLGAPARPMRNFVRCLSVYEALPDLVKHLKQR